VVLGGAIAVAVSSRGSDHGSGAIASRATAKGTNVAARPTSVAPRSCPTKVTSPPTGGPLAAFATPFQRALEDAGGTFGCPTGPLSTWQDLVVQRLAQENGLEGAIVARTPDEPFVMTNAEYGGYVQIDGKKGLQAQAVAGYPVTIQRTPTFDRIDFSKGVVLIGEDPYSPMYWMPVTMVDEWEHRGGDKGPLGLPTSNPLATSGAFGLRTDFTNGYMILSPTEPIRYVEVSDPAAGLPKDRANKILRHDDGTTWFVDEHDVRHWIPTGDVWRCKGGDAAQIGGVPGYAIATLKKGPPATC
jgi:hypothetical protein